MRWRVISIALTLAVLALATRFLLAQSVAAPIADVSVTTSATQALIRYTTNYASPCTITAAEGDRKTPVNDVDTRLFPGSNSDARFSEWQVETRRVFVLGRRTSDRSGNQLYSRALAADTPYAFRITCGDNFHDGTFRTSTVAAGELFPEPAPFSESPSAFGNYAWPTIDWSDKTRRYTDPMTGVNFQLMSTPGAHGGRGLDKPFGAYKVLGGGTSWRDAANITSGTPGRLAEYSGPGNESIFVAVDPTAFSCPYCNSYGVSGFNPLSVIDDLAAHVYGSATDAGADGDINICLTSDSGQTCRGTTQTLRLPRGTREADAGNVPSDSPKREFSPKAEFGGWGAGAAIRKREMPAFGTAAAVNGKLTLTNDDGAQFRSYLMESYAPGSLIQIAGTSCMPNLLCSIASVDSAVTATLSEPVTVGNAQFKMANVGLKIWKSTGKGTVRLRVRMDYAFSLQPDTTKGGNDDRCSRTTVTVSYAADGVTPITPKPAYLCGFPYSPGTSGQAMYLVPLDGEGPRLISLFRPDYVNGSNPGDRPANGSNPSSADWDWKDATTLYLMYPSQAGPYALYRLQYDAAACRFKTLDYRYGGGEGGDLPAHDVQSDCVRWTNLTPSSAQGRSIDAQVMQRFPEYDVKNWGSFGSGMTAAGISGTHYIAGRVLGGQDTVCYVIAINTSTGTIDRAWRSWDGDESSRRRWAGCHSVFATSYPDSAGISYKQMYATTSKFGGFYEFTITGVQNANGTWRTTTGLSETINDGTYNAVCPADLPQLYKSRGGVGNNCATIRINSLTPCRTSSFADEKASYPCPWDAGKTTLFNQTILRGDTFGNQVSNTAEHFQVAKITAGPPIELVVIRRNASQSYGLFDTPNCGDIGIQRQHPNGWKPYMTLKDNVCEATDLLLFVADGSDREENAGLAGMHHDLGAPTTGAAGQITLLGAGPSYAVRTGAANRIGQPADLSVNAYPTFAKAPHFNDAITQSYASKRAWSAEARERVWALDFRHINGGLGAAPEWPDSSIGGGRLAVTLQPATGRVYKIGPPQNTGGAAHNPKLTPALVWAGFHNFQDKSSSSTGDVLTDADAWKYCYAYRAGECRATSQTGDFFAVGPGLINNGTAAGNCYTNQYAKNVLCYASGSSIGGWIIQMDVSKSDPIGAGVRRLTMGLSGPGRQYVFNNVRALPDGKRAMVLADWAGGDRREYFLIDLPPFPSDSVNGTTFVPVPIPVKPGQPNRVLAKFGYAENGPPQNFYGTTRQEATFAVNATVDAATPFLFAHEVTASAGQACLTGCQLTIPAISGRVLFYELYSNSRGTLTAIPGTRRAVIVGSGKQ